MIDLHALRVFKAIVDHRGFARGAEASFLTQSAASQALRRLEDDLGTKLLVRGRPPSLTAAGARVYEHAVDVLARSDAARRDVEEMKKGGMGVLSVGASQALSREVLPRIVAAFHERHPLASFHLQTLPSREIIRVVAAGGLELGLGPFQKSMAGFAVHPLGTQRMVLYAGRGSGTLASLRRSGETALRGIPLVTSHLDVPGTRAGGGQLRDHFRTVWEVHSLDLRLWMVRSGLAVGYLPESTVKASGLARHLCPVDWLAFGIIERKVGFFHAARRPLSEPGRELLAVAATIPELLGAGEPRRRR